MPRGRPFRPGQSGNPSGRPKVIAEVRELGRQHTEETIARLADWMRSDDPHASTAACRELLDRDWGKPASVRLSMPASASARLRISMYL